MDSFFQVWNLFKASNEDTKQNYWRRFGVFIANFEQG